MSSASRLTAIDLYSGVGGWDLGLRMAGIETIGSYEWWAKANATHQVNSNSPAHEVDIRRLPLGDLPKRVTFIVGSPPCTQFSFANRGGNGNIQDGLVDIRRFLEIVQHLKPRAWAMENVPRVAGILEKELASGGSLREFADLVTAIVVVDASEFGLPQARRRMIAGSFDPALLRSYSSVQPRRTLGDVLSAIECDPVVDPIYGTTLPATRVTGRETETPLDWEELRMNREAKRFHPVYNLMQFPDSLARPARTVTATCTRVSRESIVVEASNGIRRLSLRERASLQGFPIHFQFPCESYADSLTMVGNAVPPPLAYFVAHALLGSSTAEVLPPSLDGVSMPPVVATAKPDSPRRHHPARRRFRAAIPQLRFGSGMRFELTNQPLDGDTTWVVTLYYGSSKRFQSLEPCAETMSALRANPRVAAAMAGSASRFGRVMRRLDAVTGQQIQDVWNHSQGGLHPYHLVDQLGELAGAVIDALDTEEEFTSSLAAVGLPLAFASTPKARHHAAAIVAGLVVGAWFNGLASITGTEEQLSA